MPRPIALALAPTEEGHRVPEPADAARVLEVAASRARAGLRGSLATVLERHGSAPSTPGQKLYLSEDGTCLGTVGGGAIERETIHALGAQLHESAPAHAIREFKLGAELGMCCGGRTKILIEPIEALTSCLVIGG